jgi:hypothetical protein
MGHTAISKQCIYEWKHKRIPRYSIRSVSPSTTCVRSIMCQEHSTIYARVTPLSMSGSLHYLCQGHSNNCVRVTPLSWHGHSTMSGSLHYLCQGHSTICVRDTPISVSGSLHYICQGHSTICVRVTPISVSVHYICQGHSTICVMVTRLSVSGSFTTIVGVIGSLVYLCQDHLLQLSGSFNHLSESLYSMYQGQSTIIVIALHQDLSILCQGHSTIRFTPLRIIALSVSLHYTRATPLWIKFTSLWIIALSASLHLSGPLCIKVTPLSVSLHYLILYYATHEDPPLCVVRGD